MRSAFGVRCLVVGVFVSSLVLLAAPGAARAQDTAQAAPWSGTWDTTYGELELTQTGTKVHGSYPSEDGTATVDGTVSGKTFTFRYVEPSAKGEGQFELSSDGRSFSGKWRADGEQEWGEWSGKRLATGPRSPYAGLCDTNFGRLRLCTGASPDQLVGAYSYDGGAGEVAGKLAGTKLVFQWKEAQGSGDGEFSLGTDGFTGRWRKAGEGEGDWKEWNGKRVPKPDTTWLMVLESQWETKLEEREYSWGGMLKAFFSRQEGVQVRHRRFNDAPDLVRALREVSFLPGRVVVILASHGGEGELVAGDDRVGADAVGAALRYADNVALLHFSACEMMVGDVPTRLRKAAGRAVPLSGYAVSVDWAGSAVLEFYYLDLVCGRRMAPRNAAALVKSELRFAGDEGTPGSPVGALQFRFSE